MKETCNKKSIEIVVSSHGENLSWLENVWHPKKIYNKEWNIKPNTVHLPNVGRESHTYIHHIYHNYENLCDVTVFCQGTPFDHCPNFIQIINHNSIEEMNIAQNMRANSEFCPLSNNIWKIQSNLLKKEWETKYRLPCISKVLKICFSENRTLQCFTCIWGAMFAISKQNILKFDKKIYLSLLNMHYDDWSMPYVMEFLWMELYGRNCGCKFANNSQILKLL